MAKIIACHKGMCYDGQNICPISMEPEEGTISIGFGIEFDVNMKALFTILQIQPTNIDIDSDMIFYKVYSGPVAVYHLYFDMIANKINPFEGKRNIKLNNDISIRLEKKTKWEQIIKNDINTGIDGKSISDYISSCTNDLQVREIIYEILREYKINSTCIGSDGTHFNPISTNRESNIILSSDEFITTLVEKFRMLECRSEKYCVEVIINLLYNGVRTIRNEIYSKRIIKYMISKGFMP